MCYSKYIIQKLALTDPILHSCLNIFEDDEAIRQALIMHIEHNKELEYEIMKMKFTQTLILKLKNPLIPRRKTDEKASE